MNEELARALAVLDKQDKPSLLFRFKAWLLWGWKTTPGIPLVLRKFWFNHRYTVRKLARVPVKGPQMYTLAYRDEHK